jgi:SAM-dependent MidA family methyltransferase
MSAALPASGAFADSFVIDVHYDLIMTSSALHSGLPSLSSDEARHSQAVEVFIREQITAAGGWLSFERFMELALYAPGLGYYSAGSTKIGAGGDFTTAPEMSDLFSRCLAQPCAQVLASVGAGAEILELGAGTGRMAETLLQFLAQQDTLPQRYAILEVSADLAERQRERLSRLPAEVRQRVVWLDRLPDQPLHGVVVANEVLDALPVRRFVWRAGEVRELGVGCGTGELPFEEREARSEPALQEACTSLMRELPYPLPDGYTSELCLRVNPWIATIAACLERGVLLLFDYGLPRAHYYHPQRETGTLRCHFKQRAHDNPYINVGVQDITAWVDFTRVADAALASGLDVRGFTTQAAFLLATGIEQFAAEAVADPVQHARVAGEARRLLMPGEMGEAFKVMALARHYDEPLKGFSLQDLRVSL